MKRTFAGACLLGRRLAVGGLLGNPSVGLDGLPVLHSKVVALLVDNVRVHELVDLVQVVERDHWVAVVLGVEVGVPQERAHNDAGADAAGVEQAVGLLGDFAVGVLEVAKVVDDGVSAEDGCDPPKQNSLDAFLGLAHGGNDSRVDGQLEKGSALDGLHDATVFAVVEVLEAPSRAAVVDSDAHGTVEDASDAALEGSRDIQELTEVVPASGGEVAEARVLEHFPRIVAGEFGVAVNVVGVGVVLLVHDALVFTQFEAKDTSEEEANIVDPLGLEGIAVEELVLSSKGKALELKTIKEIKRNKDGELFHGNALQVHGLDGRKDTKLVDSKGRQRNQAEVQRKAGETSSIRLLHQSNEDSIVEDAIALLAFTVLDVGPVFVVVVDLGKPVGVGFGVEQLGELVLRRLILRVNGDVLGFEDGFIDFVVEKDVDGASVGSHGEGGADDGGERGS